MALSSATITISCESPNRRFSRGSSISSCSLLSQASTSSVSFRRSPFFSNRRSYSLSIKASASIEAPPTTGGLAPAIALTDNALKHLNKMRSERNEDLCLRIGVKQGGCSGMSYTMEFEKRENARPLYSPLLLSRNPASALPSSGEMSQEHLVLRGTMRAHTDWVTAIATPIDNSDMIVTSSRDKSIILWSLTKEDRTYGVPRRRLTGHSHFVQDVILSSDGQFALSGSWDGELRLWDLQVGTCVRRFVGHTKDVLSVAFSIDNRQIVSASRDKTIKLWNTLGDCKYTIQDQDAHTDWVSCVRFSPNTLQPTIVSGSWDRTVKIWNLSNCKLRATLTGHSGYVNTTAVSPDGSLCASGGKDGVILLWDLSEGKKLYTLDAGSIIHALCFSPNRYWLCAATESSIKIWDLESKSIVVDLRVDLKQESEMAAEGEQTTAAKNKVIYCTSLSWAADGSTLFSGYTDGVIRVWGISRF